MSKLHDRRALKQDAVAFLGKIGLEFIRELLQQEVEEKCGPRNKKDPNRKYSRWGSEIGSFTVRGAKEQLVKPRVRTADGAKEALLESYVALSDGRWLTDRIVTFLTSGVSTRNYTRVLERSVRKQGVSRSSVSRRAIAATKPAVDAFLKRALNDNRYVAIFVDGIHFSKRQVVVAIGVTVTGRKQVLGMRLGATENYVVVRDLITDLIDKGLDPESKYLFVIDGSKALAQAIKAAFGERGVIQRCQEHKIRNVLGYLPRKLHKRVRFALTAAYHQQSLKKTLAMLSKIRSDIQIVSEAAANSLTEGLYETLTVQRLGIKGALFKSLRTTNAIESAFSAARRHTCRATRFRDEQQIYRWLALGLMCAERNFRVLPGHRQIATLNRNMETFDHTSLNH